MTPEEHGQKLGMELAEYQVKSQKKICDLAVHEAKFKAITAQNEAERAQNEREASALIASRSQQQAINYTRPCIIHRPALREIHDDDGKFLHWVASYGSLSAYGPTPETAHVEFDRLWVGKDEI